MEKGDLKIQLFFLFLASAVCTSWCIDIDKNAGASILPAADMQSYSIVRLSEDQIAKQYEHIVSEFKKSNRMRTGIRIGTYAVGAAALVAVGFELFGGKTIPDSLQNCSYEQLVTLVKELLERVRRLEMAPTFFSWAYFKSLCYSFIWSPVTILHASRILLNFGDNYINHVLYCANLGWFLGEKTKLGLLAKQDAPTTVSYAFEIGQLPKSIEECAIMLDGLKPGLLPTDVEYARRHLVDCCATLVDEVAQVLAFAKYLDSLSANEKNHFECAECTRFLINNTNSFCEKLEERLNGASTEKFVPLVASFNSDIQPNIIRLAESLA